MQTNRIDRMLGESVFSRSWDVPAAQDAVLLLHGVESHSGWFEETAACLARRGVAAHAFDRIGWGQSSGERGHLASYDDALAQVELIASRLRGEYARVHLAGLSWGGLLALYATLRRGILFDSVSLIAPGIIPKIDLKFPQKLRVARGILCQRPTERVPLALEVGHFTKRAECADFIQTDPHRVTSVSASFCLETLKMRKFVHETLGRRGLPPVQLLFANRDVIVDNAATAKLLSRVSAPTHLYEDAEHSLVFEAPERVAADIERFAHNVKPQPTGKHIVVMGAGAVGSAVGGLLALAGNTVTLVGRAAHAEAVNADGLTVRLGQGTRIIRQNLSAVTTPKQISAQADLAILSVKSFDTVSALESLRPLVFRDTLLMSLQNGVGNDARIAAVYPENTILGGAICAYLDFAAPGVIHWAGDRGGIAAGVMQGDAPVACAVWRNIFARCFMENWCLPEGEQRVKWSKLMLNVAFNALNAVTGLPTGQILAHPEYGMLAARALKEGFAVMRGLGIEPVNLPGYPVRQMAKLCRLPAVIVRPVLAKVTKRELNTVSSMAQDFRRQRGLTEIDEINGAVVTGAKTCGLSAPANEALCRLVREASEKPVGASTCV